MVDRLAESTEFGGKELLAGTALAAFLVSVRRPMTDLRQLWWRYRFDLGLGGIDVSDSMRPT